LVAVVVERRPVGIVVRVHRVRTVIVRASGSHFILQICVDYFDSGYPRLFATSGLQL
jgi:hypothetical protein